MELVSITPFRVDADPPATQTMNLNIKQRVLRQQITSSAAPWALHLYLKRITGVVGDPLKVVVLLRFVLRIGGVEYRFDPGTLNADASTLTVTGSHQVSLTSATANDDEWGFMVTSGMSNSFGGFQVNQSVTTFIEAYLYKDVAVANSNLVAIALCGGV